MFVGNTAIVCNQVLLVKNNICPIKSLQKYFLLSLVSINPLCPRIKPRQLLRYFNFEPSLKL